MIAFFFYKANKEVTKNNAIHENWAFSSKQAYCSGRIFKNCIFLLKINWVNAGFLKERQW